MLFWELRLFRGETKFGNSDLKFKLKENVTKRDLEIQKNLAQIFRRDWKGKNKKKTSVKFKKVSEKDRKTFAILVPYISGQTDLRKK